MSNEWQAVVTLPSLGAGELQLWRIHVPEAMKDPDIYKRHLSPIEIERAERLRVEQVRKQFITARAAVRVLLGNLLDLTANLVPITLSRYGKPETASCRGLPLFFNVAHSRETILIGLCRSSPVGVDVEYFDRNTEVLDIARNSFTEKEFTQLEEIRNPDERQRVFFLYWTRKEAIIKADGRGLSLPLNLVEVSSHDRATGRPIVIKEDSDQEAGARPWFVTDLELGEDIAASFAARLSHPVMTTFNFPLAFLSGK